MNVIDVKNLTKKFGSFVAVDDISFSLKEGEILGFLGPNGAGKTTTLQMLMGVLTPTSGSVEYFGKDLQKNREQILEKVNFSSTYTNLPWTLTVKENLTFISYLYDIKDRKKRLSEIIEKFSLTELANKRISELSAGQLTRVNLAKAFVNDPKILLLDEPTASLDVDVALTIREYLLHQRKKFNVSIIITSHNMVEVEELCDRVIVINQGKIIADDTPEDLTKTIETVHIGLLVENSQKMKEFCREQRILFENETKNRFIVDIKEKDIANFLQNLSLKKISFEEINIEKPTLEDFFLEVIKEEKQHEVA